MLATRIIPTLLVHDGKLVKGKQFKAHRVVGTPMHAMRIYANRNVDELIYLDIGATPQDKRPDFKFISTIMDGVFCPVAVGGGITDIEDIHYLFNAGADKVVIGATVQKRVAVHKIINESAKKYGSQAIVVSLNYVESDIYGGMGKSPLSFSKQIEDWGAGEIILNCIDRDGMMNGYDLEAIGLVSPAIRIPVIASGGCGTPQHMYEAIQAGASAVAASSMFLFTDQTPREAAQYLAQKGIQVRT